MFSELVHLCRLRDDPTWKAATGRWVFKRVLERSLRKSDIPVSIARSNCHLFLKVKKLSATSSGRCPLASAGSRHRWLGMLPPARRECQRLQPIELSQHRTNFFPRTAGRTDAHRVTTWSIVELTDAGGSGGVARCDRFGGDGNAPKSSQWSNGFHFAEPGIPSSWVIARPTPSRMNCRRQNVLVRRFDNRVGGNSMGGTGWSPGCSLRVARSSPDGYVVGKMIPVTFHLLSRRRLPINGPDASIQPTNWYLRMLVRPGNPKPAQPTKFRTAAFCCTEGHFRLECPDGPCGRVRQPWTFGAENRDLKPSR